MLQIIMAQWESSHCETATVAIVVDHALHPDFDLGAIATETVCTFRVGEIATFMSSWTGSRVYFVRRQIGSKPVSVVLRY